jgi:hypothetical protein
LFVFAHLCLPVLLSGLARARDGYASAHATLDLAVLDTKGAREHLDEILTLAGRISLVYERLGI